MALHQNISSHDLPGRGEKKHVFIDSQAFECLKKSSEKLLKFWHRLLFAPQEPSIS